MKILITGGRGFIARNLSEHLRRDHQVMACGRQELDLLNGDLVYDFIKDGGFDIVIHTATYDAAPKHSTKDPTLVLKNNLRMFFNVARGSDFFGKMIYFGSGAEFSRDHWVPRMAEDYFDRNVPSDPYGLSKYVMTKHTQASRNIYNLRVFGLFGKYDDWRTRFISNACCHAVLDLPIRINRNVRFDHLYIDDLCRIVEWSVMNRLRHPVYNACSGDIHEFKTLASMILRCAKKDLPIEFKESDGGQEYSGDNTLLLKEIGGFEFTPIEKGIQALYDWHLVNRDLIQLNL